MSTDKPTVVICGATAGVGRATAREFACAGYQVALIARGQQGLDETEQELQRLGAATLAIAADVADADAIAHAAERVEAELGPMDVWVNSAMATIFAPVSELTAAEIKRVTEVTYLGFVHGTLAALERMRARSRHHRAGRLGARVPSHPAAVGLLRGQVRNPRLHRCRALRAHPRWQQRARHHGAAARAQHPAVRLGPTSGTRRSPCRPSTGPRSPRARSCGRPGRRRASCGSGAPRFRPSSATTSCPGCSIG